MNKVITLPAIEGAESIPAVIGIDLAKNVFALHAVNRHGKTVLVKPHIRRDQLLGCWRNCRRVSLAWRPVQARTTGHANWPPLATHRS